MFKVLRIMQWRLIREAGSITGLQKINQHRIGTKFWNKRTNLLTLKWLYIRKGNILSAILLNIISRFFLYKVANNKVSKELNLLFRKIRNKCSKSIYLWAGKGVSEWG